MELKLVQSFLCARCGTSCTVSRAGDLLAATCGTDGKRYMLTVAAPSEAAAEPGEDPLVGQALGACRILARAGSEGGLPLYQAVDPALNLPLTVRVLPADLAADAAREQDFIRTTRLAAAVRHPALANATHLARLAQGGLYAVWPALAGQTLHQAVSETLRPTVGQAIAFARTLAEGLAALHERQVIHRNIGPRSVYVLPDGAPLLRNFAFALGGDTKPDPAEIVGQPGYLAPEQLAGSGVDGRADLYSLGALLYLMLVGRGPFSGATTADVIRSQLSAPTAAAEALAASAPGELADLVLRLLAPGPGERPPTARLVGDLLARLASHAPSTAPRPAEAPQPAKEEKLALAEPVAPAAAPARPARPEPAPRTRAFQSKRDREEAESPFGVAPDDATGDERPRRLATLEFGPRPAAQAPGPAAAAPAAAAPAAPAPSADLPGRGMDELLLAAEDQPPGGAVPEGGALPVAEPAPPRLPLKPSLIVAGILLAVGIAVFLIIRSTGSSRPEQPDAGTGREARKKTVKVPTEAEKAEAKAKLDLDKLDAFAKKNARNPAEVVKECDLFLEKHGGTPSAAAARTLREEAAAVVREAEADAASRALQAVLRDQAKSPRQRLAQLDAFLKAYAGTKAAIATGKLREQTLAAWEAAADRAAQTERVAIEKHLKAEAYGLAAEALSALATAHEGTKAGAAAAAELDALQHRLDAEFRDKKLAADALARRGAFGDAAAQLNDPLNRWQHKHLRTAAAALAAEILERRRKTVLAYGALLEEFDRLADAGAVEEAQAAAAQAADKANDPFLHDLCKGKAADAAAMLRALDRVVEGAKAEIAKATARNDQILLKRANGVGLKAAITNLSRTGLDAEMLGFKGRLTWPEIQVDQVLAFAQSAPGGAKAAELLGLGLVALRAGAARAAFDAFDEAIKLDPAALDGVLGSLRRHAQGFIYLPACDFPAGARKGPKALDAFLLGRAEVTNAEYAFFARVTKTPLPPDWKDGRDDYPVANVTWEEADAYARWLDLRLPTDLEWERAVRGTEGRLYPWGDAFDATRANMARPGPRPTPANLLQAHRHLLRRDDAPFFHLVGNVREWTATPSLAPTGALLGYLLVGGSAADPAAAAVAHARAVLKPDARDPYTGFRLAWPR